MPTRETVISNQYPRHLCHRQCRQAGLHRCAWAGHFLEKQQSNLILTAVKDAVLAVEDIATSLPRRSKIDRCAHII